MFAEPPGFDRAALTRALRDGWGIAVAALEYAPVGFGAHHYRARDTGGADWFVTVDLDADPVALERAFGTAAALREAGLEFVAAPRRRPDGRCLTVLAGGSAVSVAEAIDGASHDFGDELPAPARRRLRDALDRMHAAPVPPGAPVDPLTVPRRDELTRAGPPWGPGPYADRARDLLLAHRDRIDALFARYDALVPAVRARRDTWVVTHGEPHPGNVMLPAGGGIRLIDWDTVAVAPRERDLWMADPDRTADPGAAELYRLRWALTDICAFAHDLRVPHRDDENTALAWRALGGYLISGL